MHRLLIIKSFEKAQRKIGSKTPNRLAEHLSEFIEEESGDSFGARRLGDFYKWAIADSRPKIEVKQFVVKSLCAYLDYESFHAFQIENPSENEPPISFIRRTKIFVRKNRLTLLLLLLILLGVSAYNYATRERWMVWKNNHYREVNFDPEKLTNGDLKFYNKDRIDHFRQVFPNCNYPFFKEDGSENLWYGKNKGGVYEYFTDLGLHPGTSKTLKRITSYMVRTHICDTL